MELEIKNKIDQLFYSTGKYRNSIEFKDLLEFCRKFHYLSPYNAMLVHMQRPGAVFVGTTKWWEKHYKLTLKQSARPLIILIPFGPVDYLYDIDDFEGDNLNIIPKGIVSPFKTNGMLNRKTYDNLMNNLKCFGIKIEFASFGNQQVAQIQKLKEPTYRNIDFKYNKNIYQITIPEYYLILINNNGSITDKFAGIVHELAHFFCQHLRPVTDKWWNHRPLNLVEEEFEAETIAWLICERIGISNPSEKYLSSYMVNNQQIPSISIENILKSVNTIESLFNIISINDGFLAKKDDKVKEQLLRIKHSKAFQ